LITSSRVKSRYRRLPSIAVMNSPRISNLTNNDGDYSDQTTPNEQTPLLKKGDARFNDVVPCVSEIDEEAAQALVDKCAPREESRNIGGVISILLIGVSKTRKPFLPQTFFLLSPEARSRMIIQAASTLKPPLTTICRRIHCKCRYFACPCHKWHYQQRVQ